MEKQYAERDPYKLDVAGGYYCRHVSAMTSEGLHSKSDIAAELGHRDMVISELLEALQLSLTAMNEMGDILNFHDMADAESVEKLTPAFEMARTAINKALGKEQS